MRVLDNIEDNFGYEDEDYFETFEEVLTPDETKIAVENLDNIKKKCDNIRQEVNKPHKCSKGCICKVINIQLDMLNIHINEARSHLNAKTRRTPK